MREPRHHEALLALLATAVGERRRRAGGDSTAHRGAGGGRAAEPRGDRSHAPVSASSAGVRLAPTERPSGLDLAFASAGFF
jgi:hypothetical protein